MKGQVKIEFLGGKVKNIPLNHLEFKRELIIQKSIEHFSDEDPCIIHETYCRNMLSLELQEIISKDYKEIIGERIKVGDIDENLKEYLILKDIEYIVFK